MEYSERTKRRRISENVKRHMAAIENKDTPPSQQCTHTDTDSALPFILSDTFENNIHDIQDKRCNDAVEGMIYSSDTFSMSSSEEDDNTEEDNNIEKSYNLREKLAEWCTQYNISQAATSSLLQILQQSNLNIPKDPRTLLCTPKQTEIKPWN